MTLNDLKKKLILQLQGSNTRFPISQHLSLTLYQLYFVNFQMYLLFKTNSFHFYSKFFSILNCFLKNSNVFKLSFQYLYKMNCLSFSSYSAGSQMSSFSIKRPISSSLIYLRFLTTVVTRKQWNDGRLLSFFLL